MATFRGRTPVSDAEDSERRRLANAADQAAQDQQEANDRQREIAELNQLYENSPDTQNPGSFYTGGDNLDEEPKRKGLTNRLRKETNQARQNSTEEGGEEDRETLVKSLLSSSGDGDDPGEGKESGNKEGRRSSMSRSAKLWLAGLLAPYAVIFPLLLFTPGLDLEHLHNVTTAFRFGRFHHQLAKRSNHVAIQMSLHANNLVDPAIIPNYVESNLFKRLTKTDLKSQFKVLEESGYKFEYDTSPNSLYRRGLSRVTGPDGRVYNMLSVAESNALFDDMKGRLPTGSQVSRLQTRSTIRTLAKQTGIPLFRFRNLINRLQTNDPSVRGPPEINREVSQTRIDQVSPDDYSYGSLDSVDADEKADELVDNILDGDTAEEARDKVEASLDSQRQIFKAVSVGSLGVAIGTYACVFRDVANQIEGVIRSRGEGLEIQSAETDTLVSQNRLGISDPALISKVSQDFDKFALAASYRYAIQNERYDALDQSHNHGPDFNISKAIGVAIVDILWLSNIMEKGLKYSTPTTGLLELGTDILGNIPEVGGLFNPLNQKVGDINDQKVDEGCASLLNPKAQIAIAGAEIVAAVVATFFTGGGYAALKTSVQAMTNRMIAGKVAFTIAKAGAGLTAELAADALIYNWLIPNIIEQASGTNTAYLPNDGPRNYEKYSAGTHQRAQRNALLEGAMPVATEQASAQSFEYLAQHRQSYSEKGILNNVFATDNPYSGVTTLAINTPSSAKQAGRSVASLASHIFSLGALFGLLSSPATAQTAEYLSPEELELLYAGSSISYVLPDSEVTASNPDFNHIANTIYVERYQDRLKTRYSKCIAVDLSDLNLAASGAITDEEELKKISYPEECLENDARRYLVYWQDCNTIESIRYEGTSQAAFYSEECLRLSPELAADIALSDSDIEHLKYDTTAYQTLVNQDKEESSTFTDKLIAEAASLYAAAREAYVDITGNGLQTIAKIDLRKRTEGII